MRRHPRTFHLWPLILIAAGTALLLSNFGLMPHLYFNEWWPVLLILLGLRALMWPRDRSDGGCQQRSVASAAASPSAAEAKF